MASSSIFAFADTTTQSYNYYGITLGDGTTGLQNKNSADMLGYVLSVLSSNQKAIYNQMSNMGGGADLTTVNSYITAIDSKLGVIRDSLGIGSSLENVLSNQTSNLQHLNTIINKLSYWDNNHGRSYDISEMIFNIMEQNSSIVENTSSVPAIKEDTKYLVDIYNKINVFNGNPWGYVWRANVNATPTLNYPLNNSLVPLIKFDNNKTQYQFTYGNKSIQDFMDVINKNLVAASSFIRGVYTDYPQAYYNFASDSMVNGNSATSVMDLLKYHFDFINLYLGRITNVIADAQTIAAKKANASQEQAVLSNYTGNGSASASVADFGNIKDGVGSVKTGLNTNVSVSNIFNIFNNNDGYGFWSDDTRNELNSTRSNRNNLKARGVSDTPLYDAKISELYNAMGVKHE